MGEGEVARGPAEPLPDLFFLGEGVALVAHLLRCPACAMAAAWPAAASIPLACQCWASDAPADRLRGTLAEP